MIYIVNVRRTSKLGRPRARDSDQHTGRGAGPRRGGHMSALAPLATSPDDTGAGFHQSWFPLALASELEPGAVIGRDFLGTRVILYRDPRGAPWYRARSAHIWGPISRWARWSTARSAVRITTGDSTAPGCVSTSRPATRFRREPGSRPTPARRRGVSSGRSTARPRCSGAAHPRRRRGRAGL